MAPPAAPFSDLLRDLADDRVAGVVVEGDRLTVTTLDGHSFQTTTPPNYVTANPGFVPQLARTGVRIDVRSPSGDTAYSYGALLIGVVFMGERLSSLQLLAFGIALLGLVLATLPERAGR